MPPCGRPVGCRSKPEEEPDEEAQGDTLPAINAIAGRGANDDRHDERQPDRAQRADASHRLASVRTVSGHDGSGRRGGRRDHGLLTWSRFVTRRHGELHGWRLLVAVGGRGRMSPANSQKRQTANTAARQLRSRRAGAPGTKVEFRAEPRQSHCLLAGCTRDLKPRGIRPSSDRSL